MPQKVIQGLILRKTYQDIIRIAQGVKQHSSPGQIIHFSTSYGCIRKFPYSRFLEVYRLP